MQEMWESKAYMKWTVTSDYVKGGLTYFVENTETGERRGCFDCEPWASEMANELNRQLALPKVKVMIFDSCRVARNAMKDFIKKNQKSITSYDAFKLPYVASVEDGDVFYFMTPHYFRSWQKDHSEYAIVN